jgi:hypothetical protein
MFYRAWVPVRRFLKNGHVGTMRVWGFTRRTYSTLLRFEPSPDLDHSK